jgi:adenine-specific DNA-methyltransferase
VICRSKNGKGSKKNIASNHEYLVVYGKSKTANLRGVIDDANQYDKSDEYGRYKVDGLFRKKGQASLRTERPNMFFPLYYDKNGRIFVDEMPDLSIAYPVDSKGIERRWLRLSHPS